MWIIEKLVDAKDRQLITMIKKIIMARSYYKGHNEFGYDKNVGARLEAADQRTRDFLIGYES